MWPPTSRPSRPHNVCGAQQLSLQILPLGVGMDLHSQGQGGVAGAVGWLKVAGGNELFL